MEINLNLPSSDEIEVSVFGLGIGEGIVVHLGEGRWMIVDSCQVKGQLPAALQYLHDLGLDPSECVSDVVITHFHADHIQGMDQIVASCTSAKFWIPAALSSKEACAYIVAHSGEYQGVTSIDESVTKAMGRVLSAIDLQKIESGYASEAKIIFCQNNAMVTALSPSDEAVNMANVHFAKELLAIEGSAFRPPVKKMHPNLSAIALHINSDAGAVLLGSDVEVFSDDSIGWKAICSSRTRPAAKAKVYKVAHHGSHNGHYDPVYELMLSEDHTAVLTEMSSSNLPRDCDTKRLLGKTERTYITTQPSIRAPKREKQVELNMKRLVRSRRVLPTTVGHVQLRMNSTCTTVGLNRHAKKLVAA